MKSNGDGSHLESRSTSTLLWKQAKGAAGGLRSAVRNSIRLQQLKDINGNPAFAVLPLPSTCSSANPPHTPALACRETLEDAVRKQHDLIEKQSDELKALKRQLEDKDTALEKAK